MRLYYSFITGLAGWIGVVYYLKIAAIEGISYELPPLKMVVILVFLFLAWGINQIVNDFLGMKEDKINAPDRPMVTGELNAKYALGLSFFIMLIISATTWFYLEPIAIIPLALGVLMNVLYEFAKGHGLIANIIFGIMISMCTMFGYMAIGQVDSFTHPGLLILLTVVTIINGLMTFYTYFKDYRGDKLANKNTIVVKLGLHVSRILALVFSFLPTILFAVLYLIFRPEEMHLSKIFLFLAILYSILQIYTGYLYFRYPTGERTYFSLSVAFRAAACGMATLIALFYPVLSIMLFIVAYIFIEFLFSLHSNTKA